jgi:hypothetical protein
MAISTNGTVLARVAGALYNTQMSNATYSEVKTLDPASLTDALYARDFANATDTAVATTLVTNLGLTSVTGLVNWVAAQLTAAGAHKGAKIVDLLNGFAQMTADATYGAYATAFNASVDSALVLSQTAGNAGGTFAAAGTTGGTYSLSTSIDAIVGTSGADTFNAALVAGAESFTSLDSIDGGAGVDTLNIVSLGALTTATGATVKNVETVNLTAAAAITAADISGWTGVSTLNITSTGAISGVKAASTTDINVANGLGAVTAQGGKNVVIKAAGAVSIGSTTAASGDVTSTTTTAASATDIKGAGVLTANSNDGTITFTNGTSIVANATKAVSLADVTAHIATRDALIAVAAANAGAGTAKVADTAAAQVLTDLGTMTTAVAAASTIDANNAATLTALNASAITFAQKQAIDTAYATAFKAVGGSATLAKAAALAIETPIVAAATAAKASTLAALTTAAAATTAATAITTADTTAAGLVDGVVVTATTNTALTSATINGNYGSTGNAVTDGSTNNNTLTTLTLNNAGAVTGTGLALTNVSASGMLADVTVVNTTVGHALNYTLSGITGGTYTDINATTVNIASNGTATNVLTALSSTLATKVNLTGAAGLKFGTTTLDAAAVIDASGSSGSNTITLALGQKYIGGAGSDSVTATTTGTVQAVTVDGGAGTDTLVLGHATNFGTTGAAKYLNFETIKTAIDVDVSKFTGSAISKVILSGSTALTGLTAAQAANLVINATSTPTIGVTGAATPGQLDTVNIDVNDASSTVNSITVTAPVLAGIETLNLTATDNFTVTALTSAPALTKVTVSGAGTSSITTGALALAANTIFDASAATGAVTIDASSSTGNGLAITGSATKANTLTGNALASVLTGGAAADTITGGAGSDIISGGAGNNTLHGAAGANTITAGDGNNTIDVVGSSSANSITAGNGYNTITGGSGADTIIVGTGGNVITGAAGADLITLGAHSVGVRDTLVYGAQGTIITSANSDTITGFVSGTDIIQLTAGDNSGAGVTGSLAGLNLVAGNTAATMLTAVTDSTSVATLAAVYTALASATGLDNSTNHEFAASVAGAGGIVVREVVYTTGAAAGTYLVINDSTAGFQAATDIVIKLVGTTTFTAADLTVV